MTIMCMYVVMYTTVYSCTLLMYTLYLLYTHLPDRLVVLMYTTLLMLSLYAPPEKTGSTLMYSCKLLMYTSLTHLPDISAVYLCTLLMYTTYIVIVSYRTYVLYHVHFRPPGSQLAQVTLLTYLLR